MVYSNSILPTDAAYYKLNKATIVNGVLRLSSDGSAQFELTTEVLKALTEHFRISVLLTEAIDRYAPTLFIYFNAELQDGTHYNFTLTPTSDQGDIYTEEVKLEAGEYAKCTFTIYSKIPASLPLYELCPEAADSNVEVEINGVRQALDRLLFDYNTEPLSVGQEESVIGLITFNLKNATDLQGHLEVGYVSSADCVLTLRAYDTEVEELYTPILYDIKSGRGNIALPHSYLKRTSGFHSTYITAQVSRGTFGINTRGLLYTIDGGYLAERTLDTGVNALDITIEQTEGNTSPTHIWVVGIDANECLVKSRRYSADVTEAFTAKYSLGYAVAAAIEFNGTWLLDTDAESTKYTLITDEEPYAFWTDKDSVLWCQRGQDTTTRFRVDEHVSSVSACRGFSSNIYVEQDQGLVVLYVKNGQVLYRNYCRLSNGNYTWQGPFSIDLGEEAAISASVHRLNDYRLSFTITTATNNYWYITDRTYVNQAAPIEILYTDYTEECPVMAVFPAGFEYSAPNATATLDSTFKVITIVFDKPIRHLNDFRLDLFSTAASYITSISQLDENTLVVTTEDATKIGNIVYYSAMDCNLQFSPLKDRWVQMPSFSVSVPGATPSDTISIEYSAEASVSQRGIEKIYSTAEDTLGAQYASASASISALPITTVKTDQSAGADTISVAYTSVTGSLTQTQTGSKPI